MKSILFGNSAVSIGDAVYITVVSMLIVFFILFLISFVLSFFKYFPNSEQINQNTVNKKINDSRTFQNSEKADSKRTANEKKFSIEKIKDETMMAAMMVALIEAAGENENCFIRVKNVREIK